MSLLDKRVSYDIDGVIFMGKDIPGLTPRWQDVIITGRSFEEKEETLAMLHTRNIHNQVFFNTIRFREKTRESSGHHKAAVIGFLIDLGMDLVCHFEDDPIQAEIIQKVHPTLNIILITHSLTNKENERHIGDW